MTRVAFAQRYSLAGTILTEPWAPTGAETYYQRRREWFVACRICLAVQPCATERDARQAAKRPCPATHCAPPSDAAPRTSGALWTVEEDAIVAGHTLEEAARLLPERSYTSVAQRRRKLRREGITVARQRQPGRTCSYPDCGRPHSGHGLCQTHARMRRDGEELRPIRNNRKATTS